MCISSRHDPRHDPVPPPCPTTEKRPFNGAKNDENGRLAQPPRGGSCHLLGAFYRVNQTKGHDGTRARLFLKKIGNM